MYQNLQTLSKHLLDEEAPRLLDFPQHTSNRSTQLKHVWTLVHCEGMLRSPPSELKCGNCSSGPYAQYHGQHASSMWT
jgi:hypothetical protein